MFSIRFAQKYALRSIKEQLADDDSQMMDV